MAKSKFAEIKEVVARYQRTADKSFADYKNRIERARQRYSAEAFTDESWKIWAEVGGHLSATRTSAENDIQIICDEIKSDFDKWLLKPVNGDLLQTLNCVRNFEIKLGMAELKVLESATQDSFFGTKIFSEIAKENGYYMGRTVDAQAFMDLLRSVKSSAILAVHSYAGAAPDFIGRDLLDEWTYNGIVQGNGEQPIHLLVAASQFLEKDKTLERAEKTWGLSQVPAEYQLTKSEQKRIYDMINGIEGETAKKARLKELEEIEPDIKNKLPLMTGDYKKAVEGYIDSGSLDYVSEHSGEIVSGL